MIKEIAKYIDNNTSLVTGTTLFVGKLPPRFEGACVTVEEPSPGYRNPHPELTDEGQTPFRILVRGAVNDGYFTTRDTAFTVFTLLHGKVQLTLPVVSGPTYLVNIICNDPAYIGPDEKHRDILVIYVLVIREEN